MQKKWLIVFLCCFVLVGGFLTILASRVPLPEKVKRSCLEVMGKGTCMISHNTAYIPDEVKQVFISGYGNLNADTYRQLKNSGLMMCGQIQEACMLDVSSEVCRLGQALYPK